MTAIRPAQLGLKTAVIEKDKVGGRCLNYACIPAKAVLRVAGVASEIADADEFGITVSAPVIDSAKVFEHRNKVVSSLTGGVAGLMRKNKIDVIEGTASLVAGGGKVAVGGIEYSAKTIILATGCVRVGDRLSLCAPRPLRSSCSRPSTGCCSTEDADISRIAERGFKKQGIDVHTGVLVGDVVSRENSVTFKYGDEAGEADWVVIAAGRGPDVDALGLEAASIKLTERSLIEVDGALRTSVAGVYAIGDIVPGPALAHKAMEEGVIAIEDAAGLSTHPISYGDIPRATFCMPNVASFGLTEAQVKEPGYDVVVGKVPYGAVGAAPSAVTARSGQDHRRQEVRRAAQRPHRRRQGDRSDPGAGQHHGAGGWLSGGGADHPRPPDDVRGHPRGRPRR